MNETNNGQSQEADCGGNTKISILPAVVSLFLPGLGQLIQKRYAAGAVFFVCFLVTAVLPCIAFLLFWFNLTKNQADMVLMGLIVCFFPITIIFLSIIETLLYQHDGKTHFTHPLGIAAALFLPVCFVLSLPAVSAARELAYRMECLNRIKQIALAIYNYADEHNGQLPPAYTTDQDGKPLHSWRVLLLPYLEEQTLYDKIRLDEPWDSEYNKQFHVQIPRMFQCSMNRQVFEFVGFVMYSNKTFQFPSGCNYSLVTGEQTAFRSAADSNQRVIKFDDIKDGTSNTIILVERLVPVNWMEPDNDIPFEKACDGIDKRIDGIGSMHPSGCNCGFADGSVRFIHDDIAPDEWKAKLTMNGGESSPQ